MGFSIGQTVGDYLILDDLGVGGAGQVYEVEHTITRRREAMKVLVGKNQCPVQQADRFFRAIRLQASLSHAYIAAVHNAFWADDDLVLVCELLDGEPLHDVLERGRLALPQSLDIISQVLAALGHAHSHGVMHQDVSPANIFLTSEGTVKLIDFGLAKAAADLRVTQQGAARGASPYMTPEQVRGEDTLDARSDLYACGVVLYEMVTGAKPFTGENGFDMKRAQTEESPELPHSVDPALPQEIDSVVQVAMARKPEQRFQSADGFQKAVARLRHCVDQQSVARHSLTHRRAVIAIGAVGLLLILSVRGSVRPIPQRDISSQQTPAVSAAQLPTPLPLPKQRVDVGAARTKEPLPAIRPTAASASPNNANIGGKNPFAKFGHALKRLNPFRRRDTPRTQAEE